MQTANSEHTKFNQTIIDSNLPSNLLTSPFHTYNNISPTNVISNPVLPQPLSTRPPLTPPSSHNKPKMSSPYKPHIRSTSPPSSYPSRKRIGSDEQPSHEPLIELSPSPSNSTMADRFPSLDDFGAGKPSHHTPTMPPIYPSFQFSLTQSPSSRTDFPPRPHRRHRQRFPHPRARRFGGRRSAVRRRERQRCHGGRWRRRGSPRG